MNAVVGTAHFVEYKSPTTTETRQMLYTSDGFLFVRAIPRNGVRAEWRVTNDEDAEAMYNAMTMALYRAKWSKVRVQDVDLTMQDREDSFDKKVPVGLIRRISIP